MRWKAGGDECLYLRISIAVGYSVLYCICFSVGYTFILVCKKNRIKWRL